MNADKRPFGHDEDLSYPFSSPEGREAGRRGNVGGGYEVVSSSTPAEQVPWPAESRLFNGWVALPFHRLNVISPPTSAGGFGLYRDRVPYPGYSGWDLLRNVSTLPISEGNNPNPTSGFQLFPVPDKVVPVNPTYYYEWPSPTEPCAYPDQNPDPPYLSQTGLDWTQQPYGLPLSVSMFARVPTTPGSSRPGSSASPTGGSFPSAATGACSSGTRTPLRRTGVRASSRPTPRSSWSPATL
jgi:hypothetical protein